MDKLQTFLWAMVEKEGNSESLIGVEWPLWCLVGLSSECVVLKPSYLVTTEFLQLSDLELLI